MPEKTAATEVRFRAAAHRQLTGTRVPKKMAAVLSILLLSAGVAAARSEGSFRFAFAGERDYTTVAHPGESVTAGSVHGLFIVTEADDPGPFTEDAVLHGTCVVRITTTDAGPSIEATCLIDDDDQDELRFVARRDTGDAEIGGGGEGAFTLLGGTGKFARVEGGCPYRVHYLDDGEVVVFGRCEWRIGTEG